MYCNRARTHTDINGREFKSGKLNWFPLSDENKRMKYGQTIDEEEKVRLLINPCVDKPEEMISYLDDGAIVPKTGISFHNVEMVKTSVKIYALHRSDLYKARNQKRLRTLYVINNLKDRFQKYLNEPNADNLDRLETDLNELKQVKEKGQEHLGVVRYFIRKELTELKKIIRTLTNA